MGEKIYGLLGRRLGHSWSVPIHQALGCGSYRLIELEPDQLGDFLAREDIGGLNVTIPYKRTVMAFCDEIDPAARDVGSVNTLVCRDGKLWGYNTDVDGFLYMLRRAGIVLRDKKVLILGSGGASLAVQAAAKQENAREIVVISRTGSDNYVNLKERHGDAQVLVNTTPVGMWPDMDARPVDLTALPSLEAAADVIYNPGRTELLLQAAELGLRRAGGLSMLAAQAVRTEELFFDRPTPEEKTEEIIAQLRRERTNIVLVGMPGCGKTTIGRALSALTGRPLADLDEEIVRRTGKAIPEIFQENGEAVFRELERQVLAEFCARDGQVIATGGGTVLRADNRAAMRRTGRVYFLRRDLALLPTEGRPLSQAGSLAELYRVRRPLYSAAADVHLNNDASPEEVAELIWRDFCG